ncbi:hypothetical protein BgiBS90_033186 [Biomphalaria glabrata]|nr:hypothetical protein BgiBS90_033186 [Biomphalaria glabrata]
MTGETTSEKEQVFHYDREDNIRERTGLSLRQVRQHLRKNRSFIMAGETTSEKEQVFHYGRGNNIRERTCLSL